MLSLLASPDTPDMNQRNSYHRTDLAESPAMMAGNLKHSEMGKVHVLALKKEERVKLVMGMEK